MATRPRTLLGRFPHVAALAVMFGCMCLSASQASAQGVTITSPTEGSTVSGTIPVRAQVNWIGTIVAGVQFKRDGANLGAEDTTAPYEVPWDTTTASNGSHSLTAVARDIVGLRYTSDPVEVTVSNGSSTATRFEETDLATSYTTGWYHYLADRPFSGGTAAVSPKTDGRAIFTFVGRSVKWIGFRGPQTGIALVFLDGAMVAQVDTYSPTEEVKAIIFSAEDLAYGSHELWIEVTGLKHPASWDSAVIVDAFDVAPAAPPPTFTSGKRTEQTAASVSYTTGWTQGNRMTAWSGGTAAVSVTPGARATFNFTGTSVNWIGLRGPNAGIARVFIDGTLRATVDLYEPFALQAVVFSASGLANASHALRIEVTGLHNSASTDSIVAVDAFDTRARFEETHSSLNYTETWEVTVSRAWSEKTAVFTWVTDAHAIFNFTGTSVRWISYRGPLGGIARVYLDGIFVRDIDTYAADETHQAIMYEATGLAPGSHVLTIVNTGQMNPLSRNPYISVDAFDTNF
jgi:hypothetical protein